MTTEKHNELYDKYQAWIGQPVELLSHSSQLGKHTYKKFLLKDISNFPLKEESGGKFITTSVLVKDLETSKDFQINLSEFDKTVRLIQLGNAPTVKITNKSKSANILVGKSSECVEVFKIQINSHFNKRVEDWIKIVDNIYISFNLKRTNQNKSEISDRVYLSSLITNQVQPVFNTSLRYPTGSKNKTNSTDFYDTLEIVVGELSPINENFEIAVIYNKYP